MPKARAPSGANEANAANVAMAAGVNVRHARMAMPFRLSRVSTIWPPRARLRPSPIMPAMAARLPAQNVRPKAKARATVKAVVVAVAVDGADAVEPASVMAKAKSPQLKAPKPAIARPPRPLLRQRLRRR